MFCVYRDAQMIMEDIKRAISELEQEASLPPVGVELVDNELATLYMNSKKSEVNASLLCSYHTLTHLWFHSSTVPVNHRTFMNWLVPICSP